KEKIFVAACDMPLLDTSLVKTILSVNGDYDAVIPREGKQPQFLAALYSRKVLPELDQFLREGGRSIFDFCKTLNKVHWLTMKDESFFNVNSPEEFQHLVNKNAKR
ncbi:MAG: NTP transferase domain-containing protein, partial [bacterium]|nr:NTP transferase domain-containing protein [bacterium]